MKSTGLAARIAGITATAAAFLIIAPSVVHATPPSADAEQAEAGQTIFGPDDVVVGPRLVFRVRTPSADGLSAPKRAEGVRERLLSALASDRALVDAAAPGKPAADAVTVRRNVPGGAPELCVYGTPIVAVDAALARANGAVSPEALASLWASRLRSALASAEAQGALADPMRVVSGLPAAAPVRPAARVAQGSRGIVK